MLTHAHTCSRMLTHIWHMLKWLMHAHPCSNLLTHAHICSHMFTYAHTCSGMLTHAQTCSGILTPTHTCSHILTHAHTFSHMLAHVDTFSHMLTHADRCSHILTQAGLQIWISSPCSHMLTSTDTYSCLLRPISTCTPVYYVLFIHGIPRSLICSRPANALPHMYTFMIYIYVFKTPCTHYYVHPYPHTYMLWTCIYIYTHLYAHITSRFTAVHICTHAHICTHIHICTLTDTWAHMEALNQTYNNLDLKTGTQARWVLQRIPSGCGGRICRSPFLTSGRSTLRFPFEWNQWLTNLHLLVRHSALLGWPSVKIVWLSGLSDHGVRGLGSQ